jgi:hypothetical protein
MELKKNEVRELSNGDKLVGVNKNERDKHSNGRVVRQIKNKWGKWVSKAKSLAGKAMYKKNKDALKPNQFKKGENTPLSKSIFGR